LRPATRGNLTYREDFGRSHFDYLSFDERNHLIEFKRLEANPGKALEVVEFP